MGRKVNAKPTSTTFKTGVTVGKFNPPHLGHLHLIATAAKQVETLYVLVCHKEGQINAKTRASWLEAAAPPNCRFVITGDDLPEAPEPWAQRAKELIPAKIEIAFTSEEYGVAWAAAMNAEHHCVDLERSTYPVSASRIKNNPIDNFKYLVPAARSALCKRFVLAGPESSGKTTLAKALADSLDTAWVPEYGRLYCDGRGLSNEWNDHEFSHIAQTQQSMIDALAHHANNGVLISDTDALVTRVWQKRYLPLTAPIALPSVEHYYFVCDPVPWKQDGTRESEQFRDQMLSDTLDLITQQNTAYTQLQGNHEERLQTALKVIKTLTRDLLS